MSGRGREGVIMRTVMLAIVGLSLVAPQLSAGTYYVSTAGDDAYPGTIDLPFKTIPRGVTAAFVGDTIFVRGGIHVYNTTINISKQGMDSSWFYLLAFPGERPFLDFSSMPTSTNLRGINLSGTYWHIKGFDIYRAGDNGMLLRGHYNVIEFCSFFENRDTGLQLSNGASNNRIINCDSYYNVDTTQGNADGFAPKLDVGTGNYFYGCRAWQNSDDGWDGYLRPSNGVITTIENSWCFMNGYLKTGLPSVGNGNGYKMGGGDNGNADSLRHIMILRNCLAFDNRVKGYDQNNNRGSMVLLNCTGYRNGTNYSVGQVLASEESLVVKNCAALGSSGPIASFAIQQTNSWMSPFVVTTEDFVSVDTAGMRAPRKPDGSLPDITFMHLAQGSDLIDAGTDIGLPFNGTAPDLGCFETDGPVAVEEDQRSPEGFVLDQNYPNPFNPSTTFEFQIPRLPGGQAKSEFVSLKVFDILGQEVVTLVNEQKPGGSHTVTFDGSRLAGGVYFYRLVSGAKSVVKKLTILK